MSTIDHTVAETESHSMGALLLRITDNLWRLLLQLWLPLFCVGLLGLLVMAALLLPQLPSQLSEDPGAVARWLSSTADNYPLVGGTLAGAGFFNAMNSLLWRFLTVTLAFLLLLHLLRLWLLDRQIASARNALTSAFQDGNTPILLPSYPPLHSQRLASAQLPQATHAQIVAHLQHEFVDVQKWQSAEKMESGKVEGGKIESDTVEDSGIQESISEEGMLELKSVLEALPDPAPAPASLQLRSYGTAGTLALRLRILLLLGGVLASAALWRINTAGWRIQTAPLTPLERFRDDWRNVAVEFAVGDKAPTLVVQQSNLRTELPVTATTATERSGLVRSFAGPPTLLIQSLSDNAELKRPDGASSLAVGLLFPSPGSEEILLLPQHETVLRIVRGTDANPLHFTIEAIQAGIEETNRFTIKEDERHTFKLGNGKLVEGQPAQDEVSLRFLPLYSRRVEIVSLPGFWLLLPAALLTVLGLFGLRSKTGFVLVQVAAWPIDRSVVIVQGSEREVVEQVCEGVRGDKVTR